MVASMTSTRPEAIQHTAQPCAPVDLPLRQHAQRPRPTFSDMERERVMRQSARERTHKREKSKEYSETECSTLGRKETYRSAG